MQKLHVFSLKKSGTANSNLGLHVKPEVEMQSSLRLQSRKLTKKGQAYTVTADSWMM